MQKEYSTKFIIHSQETRNGREIPQGLQPACFLCPCGFSRQGYWSGLPCPPSSGLPNPGIKPRSPALQVDSLLSEPPGKLLFPCYSQYIPHPPSPTVSTSLFFMFASPLLPCKQVHQYHLSRSYICVNLQYLLSQFLFNIVLDVPASTIRHLKTRAWDQKS